MRPPSREGKKAITCWVEPALKRQFNQLCLDNDVSAQDAIEQAIALLFEHYKPNKYGQSNATDRAFWDHIRVAVEKKYAKRQVQV